MVICILITKNAIFGRQHVQPMFLVDRVVSKRNRHSSRLGQSLAVRASRRQRMPWIEAFVAEFTIPDFGIHDFKGLPFVLKELILRPLKLKT